MCDQLNAFENWTINRGIKPYTIGPRVAVGVLALFSEGVSVEAGNGPTGANKLEAFQRHNRY